jgi:hypothetical protein
MRKPEVLVDSRGKVSLSFRKHKHDRYLAEEDPDGTIHLVPAVLVPARLKAPASPLDEQLEAFMPSAGS